MIRVQNRLSSSDLASIIANFQNCEVNHIVLLPGIDEGSAESSSLSLHSEGVGYTIRVKIHFYDLIGMMICQETHTSRDGITTSPEFIELSIPRKGLDTDELSSDITYACRIIGRMLNYSLGIHEKESDAEYIVDAKTIAVQKVTIDPIEEAKKRSEEFVPFAIVHSSDLKSLLKVLPPDLVPIYESYDRFDLYGAQKTYRLLPRSFIANLLRCDKEALIAECSFDHKGKETLDNLVNKGYLKKRIIASKVYLYDLQGTTRVYLNNKLRLNQHGDRS